MKPHVAQGLPNTEFDDQSIGQETDLIDWTGFSDAWPYFSPSLSRIDDNPSSTDQWNNAELSGASAPEGPRITDGQPGGLSAGPANPDAFGATGATAAQLRLAVGDSGLTVTGAGIKIGVLSDSFDNLGGAAADVADGALPAGVTVLEDLASGGTDEGRAIMQIVHDIAPGASLYFHTAFSGEQDFANGILALAAAGCKVICDDVSYFDEPFFQNGIVAQAIQTVEQEGVVYVTAAGNDAGNAYQAAWTPLQSTAIGQYQLQDAESFAGNPVQTITIGGSDHYSVPLLLEWNQPYGLATADLDVLVFQNGSLIDTETNASNGEPSNPWVEVDLTGGASYQIAIENLSGPDPGQIKEIALGNGIPVSIAGANSGTVFGHAMSPYAITVGAVNVANTPAFGVSPPVNESYSSSGAGTELLFDNNGNALSTPDLLNPITVSGVDNIHTTVAGLSDFYGTSAATPTVAAIAALMLQENPNLSPTQISHLLAESALPFGNPSVSGAGLVQANAAVALAADMACFCRGTLILADRGEVPVEDLAAGDLVMTLDGCVSPVRWIGRRTVSSLFADPLRVAPIRIKAGALEENVPSRDLRLSPDHALFIDGLLIQAGALVNQTSIVRETDVPATFTYYHVELDEHSLILVENAPAETFVDNIDRLAFDNWEEDRLRHTARDAIIEMAYPRAKAYRQVPLMIRERLAARAAVLYGEYASELPIFRQLANIGEQRGIGVTGGK